jgi:hypothetical protein
MVVTLVGCGFFVWVDIYSVSGDFWCQNSSGSTLGVLAGGDLRMDESILKDDNGKMRIQNTGLW